MSRPAFRVIIFMFILGAAGAARGQEASGPCESRPPSGAAYYADMKLMPEGRYTLSYMPDRAQFDDASTPFVVRSVNAVTSSKERSGKLACAEVENRSGRAVKALRLRWFVTARPADGVFKKDAEVLSEGLLPTVWAEVAPGARKKIELTGAHFADFMRPVAAAGEPSGAYEVSVGVARVEFADGTFIDLP